MRQVIYEPRQRPAAIMPHTADCVSHIRACEVPTDRCEDMAKALGDARYWTRLRHYVSLHSDDGLQLAKRCTLRDHAQRGAASVGAMAEAWKERHRNPAHFVSQRDAALKQIETELHAAGLPFAGLFETSDFIPIDCNTGQPAKF